MKVATWNVNSVRARRQRLLTWLESRAPDVVCLQETKVVDGDFPTGELEEAGYHSAAHGQKTYNGVAILAQSSLEDVSVGLGDGGDDSQARLIAATVDGVRVISAYVPNGKAPGTPQYEYKLEWLGRLRRYLDARHRPDEPLVLCGDFNVAPDDRDVHDPLLWEGEILCTDTERAALAEVVDWGLTDTFRQHHEEGGLFSWWDYRMLAFPKNRGLRIDFVLATEPMASRCQEAFIDRDERKGRGPSDHAPVISVFAD